MDLAQLCCIEARSLAHGSPDAAPPYATDTATIALLAAYAHSVFATSCALNVPATASAFLSSTLITPAPCSRPIVAFAHRMWTLPAP